MPNIRTYDAPLDRLSPDNRGNSAFETAARRIGPLYSQAAEDIKSAAAAKARSLKDSEWPFSIADLEASLDDVRARRATTSGSGGGGASGTEGFKLAGDINSFFKGGGGSTGRFPSAKPAKSEGKTETSSDRANAEIMGSAAGLTRLTRNLLGNDGTAPGGLVKVGPGMYAPDTRVPGFAGSKVDLSDPDSLIIPGFTGKRGDLGVTGEDTGMKYPLPGTGGGPDPLSPAAATDLSNDYARRGVNIEELPGSVPAGADTGVSPDIPDQNSGHWWDSYIPSFPWSNSSDSGSQTVTAPIPAAGSDSGDYGGGGDF